jgi:hypothetical protein
MIQIITPNPHIPCRPGWCLMYVRQAFGLPARYASATEAWEASETQHRDRDFPAGVWTPVWYGIDREPLGHVVLLAPDGSVYSTSDNSTVPHHHPSLQDLEDFYAGWDWPLTYRGWTEDVAGYPVIASAGIQTQSSTIEQPKEWDEMASREELFDAMWGGGLIHNNELGRGEYPRTTLGAMTDRIVRQQLVPLRAEVSNLVAALNKVAGGEPFDEAKLLAGVQAASEAGVKAAIESIDTTVTVK